MVSCGRPYDRGCNHSCECFYYKTLNQTISDMHTFYFTYPDSYRRLTGLLLLSSFLTLPVWSQVTTVEALVAAVNEGSNGDEVLLVAGTFELSAPLRPKEGMTIRGAGRGKTVIRGGAAWKPGTAGLPDREVDHKSVNREAYLFDLGDNTKNVTISDLTLKGP